MQINPSAKKSMWKACKPFFSEKNGSSSRITLVENNEIISDEFAISNIFNQYFINTISTLSIPRWPGTTSLNNTDPITSAIIKYSSHPSIIKIKSTFNSNHKFKFNHVSTEEISKVIGQPK